MNVKESVAYLRKIGWHVSKRGSKWTAHEVGSKRPCPYVYYFEGRPFVMNDGKETLYTDRELIKLAKQHTSLNHGESAIKADMKDGEKRKRRPKERNLLQTRDIDGLDALPTKIKSNRWDYD